MADESDAVRDVNVYKFSASPAIETAVQALEDQYLAAKNAYEADIGNLELKAQYDAIGVQFAEARRSARTGPAGPKHDAFITPGDGE